MGKPSTLERHYIVERRRLSVLSGITYSTGLYASTYYWQDHTTCAFQRQA